MKIEAVSFSDKMFETEWQEQAPGVWIDPQARVLIQDAGESDHAMLITPRE